MGARRREPVGFYQGRQFIRRDVLAHEGAPVNGFQAAVDVCAEIDRVKLGDGQVVDHRKFIAHWALQVVSQLGKTVTWARPV
ncbi:MAG: hypothetical protein GYA59_16800, partial [Chloroflexi bacterium]|nr:hypothetical protein [Chloroflexota bacterium]